MDNCPPSYAVLPQLQENLRQSADEKIPARYTKMGVIGRSWSRCGVNKQFLRPITPVLRFVRIDPSMTTMRAIPVNFENSPAAFNGIVLEEHGHPPGKQCQRMPPRPYFSKVNVAHWKSRFRVFPRSRQKRLFKGVSRWYFFIGRLPEAVGSCCWQLL